MKRLNTALGSTMIGKTFTFYLGNVDLGKSYYQYQMITPGLSDTCTPLISLTKIDERAEFRGPDYKSKDSDLLFSCLGSSQNLETKGYDLISQILYKEKTRIFMEAGKFPSVEMILGNNMQKSLIIGLRDALRWKQYRFLPGRKIDVMYTPNTTLLMEIVGGGDTISLEPIGLFDSMDINFKSPLQVDLGKLDYPNKKFNGKMKVSELNRDIRRFEWSSFDRQ